ncbi:MAG: FecR domain-containing protein [Myxococcaceae bacterium]|nr:FecR domain-containing protein [Myxococcaceae bacterium]
MRVFASLLLGGALAGLSACSGPDPVAPPPPPVAPPPDAGAKAKAPAATLLEAVGPVTVTRGGTTRPGAPGPLFDGDVLETGEAARAVVRLADGRTLELAENGRLEVDASNDGLVLEVGQGVVVTRERAGGDGPTVQLTLDTPYGLVRVGSAGLLVNVGADEAGVDVLAGEVTLVGREGSAIELNAGAAGTLGKGGATRRVTLEPLTVILSAGSGRIDVKKKDGKAFTAVNPKKPPALAAGDTLRVSAGSATLTPAGSDAKVTLGAGTEVGVGESVKAGGAEDLGLELKKGQLSVVMPFGKKRTLRPGDGATLVAEQGGQLSVVRAKNGLELNSVVGDVLVTLDGGGQTLVKGGQTATVTKDQVTTRDVAREALQLPSRGGLRLLHPGAERVALVWSADDDGPFRFTLASEPSFDRPLVDGVVHQPFFNTPAPARGALYWRVSRGDQEFAKGSVSCAPEKVGDELGGITNEVPAGPEKTVIFFQDKPPALTFTWKAPDKPVASYQLKVYRAGQLGAPLQERTVSTTTAQLPLGTLGEGKYQWDVTWLDAKGTPVGTAGKMNQLELNYDNAVRALVIKSPRNGDPPAGRVAVAGIAPIGIKVTANGQAVALDAKARFTGSVAPLSGARVVFRAVQDGAETYIVRWLGGRGAR